MTRAGVPRPERAWARAYLSATWKTFFGMLINVVGVTIEVRSHGNAERGRRRYRKSWLLENVRFTLATESPSPAPTQHWGTGEGTLLLP